MRRPIRLNRNFCRKLWPGMQRGCPDPRGLLDAGISDGDANEIPVRMKIHGIFKTTWADRFPQTTRLLADSCLPPEAVIADVGASAGSTSLSVMQSVRFGRYYETDNASRSQAGIMKNLFASFNRAKCKDVRKVPLMNRALLSKLGDDVRLERHDVFEAWPHEKADLVIAANILNRDYFANGRLADALRNLKAALKENGRLVLIENRPAEQSNLFRLEQDRFIVESQVGTGSDIKSLVLGLA